MVLRMEFELKKISSEVKDFLKNELAENGNRHRVEEIKDEVVALSKNALTRKEVRAKACEYAEELACWYIVHENHEWESLLSELNSNRVPVRDIDTVRRVIKTKVDTLSDELLEMMEVNGKLVVLKDVSNFRLEYDNKTLKIWVLE